MFIGEYSQVFGCKASLKTGHMRISSHFFSDPSQCSIPAGFFSDPIQPSHPTSVVHFTTGGAHEALGQGLAKLPQALALQVGLGGGVVKSGGDVTVFCGSW